MTPVRQRDPPLVPHDDCQKGRGSALSLGVGAGLHVGAGHDELCDVDRHRVLGVGRPSPPKAYVANSGSDSVSIIDASTDRVAAATSVGSDPVAQVMVANNLRELAALHENGLSTSSRRGPQR
ncbi:hypothetical protein [Streptomyces hirsutus]|uniref:hypothetical protein n=1 Tax=Streptomyces hirsutus TaxID=35620 RepID=UPI00332A637B